MVLLRKKLWKILKGNKKKIHYHRQLTFLKRLHRLLNNGYALLDALEVLAWDDQLNPIAQQLHHELINGKPLDEAFAAVHFHKLIVIYLYFVRINSDLITTIEKAIILFEQRIQAINKFHQVIRYPLLLLTVFCFLLLFIKLSVLPAYSEMFQMYTQSTNVVQMIIFVINLLTTAVVLVVALFICSVVIWNQYAKKLSVEERLRIYQKVPLWRNYITWQTSFYFATHVSILLKTGLSLKELLKFMAEQKELPIIAYYAGMMRHHLAQGYPLAELLLALPFIDAQIARLFQKNNERDFLEKDLATYADILFENIEKKMMRAITLLQPMLLTVLGTLIIFIYLSLMLPMFQLLNAV